MAEHFGSQRVLPQLVEDPHRDHCESWRLGEVGVRLLRSPSEITCEKVAVAAGSGVTALDTAPRQILPVFLSASAAQ